MTIDGNFFEVVRVLFLNVADDGSFITPLMLSLLPEIVQDRSSTISRNLRMDGRVISEEGFIEEEGLGLDITFILDGTQPLVLHPIEILRHYL